MAFNLIAILDGVLAFIVDRILKWINKKITNNKM